ncbi:MAG: hypothetical protein ABUS79_16820 [Pseudomonadota bacterium]
MKTNHLMLAIAFTTGASAVAVAQPSNDNAGDTPVLSRPAGPLADVPVIPAGFALQAGGGVTSFSRQAARDDFKTGGYWDVRATVGNRSFIGAELAYVGSAREIQTAGASSSPALVGNGGEAVARANLPLQLGVVQLTPFAFGGVGWTHYQVASGDVGTNIKRNSNSGVVPFGAGADLVYGHFVVDARFTYRTLFKNTVVQTDSGDHLDMQNWSAGLTAGYEL